MQYPLGRKKIIHMISLHYLSLNEEKYAARMLSPLLAGDASPLRISGGSLQAPAAPFLHNQGAEAAFGRAETGFRVPSFWHHLWLLPFPEIP